MKRFVALFCALMLLAATASAETLRVYYTGAPQSLMENHPGLAVVENDWDRDQVYETTSEFAGAMMTRSFNWDVFMASTRSVDFGLLMEKGYLLDLSGSEVIRSGLERMYPFLVERCMHDGRIYAVPTSVYVERPDAQVAVEVWEGLGYAGEDVPQSFPALLDFIDAYLDRREDDPGLTDCVWANLDAEDYNEHWYARKLVKMLVDSHVRQCQWAGVPIRFGAPEMVALLERTRAVAARIFAYEPVRPGDPDRPWPGIIGSQSTRGIYTISTRLSEEQPMLEVADVHLVAAYAGTAQPELAVEALEGLLGEIAPYYQHQFFTDAQPIENADYAHELLHWSNLIAMAERRLAGDNTPWTEYLDLTYGEPYAGDTFRMLWDGTEGDAQDWLDEWKLNLEYTEGKQYLVSPDTIEQFSRQAERLCLPGSSVFTGGGEGRQNLEELQNQFADGLISAEQFAREADRIAEMVELENQ